MLTCGYKHHVPCYVQAASPRGMAMDAMQEVAQDRMWPRRRALAVGLVDSISRAVAVVKYTADLGACYPSGWLHLPICAWYFRRGFCGAPLN